MGRTTEEFINLAKNVHGDNYVYDKVDYKRCDSKVEIYCTKHKEYFQQDPSTHLKGSGCKKCGREKTKAATKNTTDSFIKASKEIHGESYNYDKVLYNGSRNKVIVTCPIHGDFNITPDKHIQRRGCPKCVVKGWTDSSWKVAGEKSLTFDSYKLYLIRCWNETEEFYKIGRTFMKIDERFQSTRIPYEYEVLKVKESEDSSEIFKLENTLQKENKKHLYLPQIKFDGMHECFSKVNNNF